MQIFCNNPALMVQVQNMSITYMMHLFEIHFSAKALFWGVGVEEPMSHHLLKVVTNETGGAVGDVLTIIC